MTRTQLKQWLATAVDGRDRDAYYTLLFNLPPQLRGKLIRMDDLVVVLQQLSRKWQKEITKYVQS